MEWANPAALAKSSISCLRDKFFKSQIYSPKAYYNPNETFPLNSSPVISVFGLLNSPFTEGPLDN